MCKGMEDMVEFLRVVYQIIVEMFDDCSIKGRKDGGIRHLSSNTHPGILANFNLEN